MNTHAATSIIKPLLIFIIAFSSAWSNSKGSDDDPTSDVATQSRSQQTEYSPTRSDLWTLAARLCEAQLKVDESRLALLSRRADRVDELHASGLASWREAKECRLKAEVAKHRCIVRQKMLDDLRGTQTVIEPFLTSSTITMEVRLPGQTQPLSWISKPLSDSVNSGFSKSQYREAVFQCFQFERSKQLIVVETERLGSRLNRMREAGFSEGNEEFLVAGLLLRSLELQVDEEAARRTLIEAALTNSDFASVSPARIVECNNSVDMSSSSDVELSLDSFQRILGATRQRHALAFAMRQHSEHRLRAVQQLEQSGFAKPIELKTAESDHALTEQMFLQLKPASAFPSQLQVENSQATDRFFSSSLYSLDIPALLLLLQYREREVDLQVSRFELERRREALLELQVKLIEAGRIGGSSDSEQETNRLELEGLTAMLGVLDQNLFMWRQAQKCVALISSRRHDLNPVLQSQQESAKKQSAGFLATTLAVSPIDSAGEDSRATSLIAAVEQLKTEGFASQAELDQVNTNARKSSLVKLITQDRLRAERVLLRFVVSTPRVKLDSTEVLGDSLPQKQP